VVDIDVELFRQQRGGELQISRRIVSDHTVEGFLAVRNELPANRVDERLVEIAANAEFSTRPADISRDKSASLAVLFRRRFCRF